MNLKYWTLSSSRFQLPHLSFLDLSWLTESQEKYFSQNKTETFWVLKIRHIKKYFCWNKIFSSLFILDSISSFSGTKKNFILILIFWTIFPSENLLIFGSFNFQWSFFKQLPKRFLILTLNTSLGLCSYF